MSTLNQILRQARTNIAQADKVLLKGSEFPRGRYYNIEEVAKEKKEASVFIVTAYKLLMETGQDNPELMNHLYYLARDVYQTSHDIYELEYDQTPQDIIDTIKQIASEGRQLELAPDRSIGQRLRDLRLFVVSEDVFPAQIRDSKRGCSASICTNCFEPIAYSTEKCPNCKFEVIGPFGFPQIEVWQTLTNRQKIALIENVYRSEKHGKLGMIVAGGKLKPMVFSKAKDFKIDLQSYRLFLIEQA